MIRNCDFKKLKKSIQRLNLWQMSLAILIFAAASLATLIGHISDQYGTSFLLKIVNEQSKASASVLAGASLDAIISEDIPLLTTIVEQSVKKQKNLLLVRIHNEDRKVLSEWRSKYELLETTPMVSTQEVVLGGETFGHITLAWDISVAKKEIKQYVSAIRWVTTGLLVFFALFIFACFNFLIFTPLHRITKCLKTVNLSHMKPSSLLSREMAALQEGVIERFEYEQKQKSLMKDLAQAKQSAEAATYAKGQFLANMSHEIRTPLTAILGFAESARMVNALLEDKNEALALINESAEHLLDLVNDILDVSKIDAGALRVEFQSVEFFKIIKQVENTILPKLYEKELGYQFLADWDLPKTISSDSLRLTQVLVNLFSNAVKFTSDGQVCLKVSCDKQREILKFTVQDTGIGMNLEQQRKIFEPFAQADVSTTRVFGGTGLGLAISKQLVNRMGGDIEVQSEPGVGTSFTFWIPTGPLKNVEWLSSIPETKVEAVSSDLGEGFALEGKVLIVDDNAVNRRLLEFKLKNTEVEIALAENGKTALEKVANEEFDLILLDMQMPVMDGYSTVEHLRATGCKVPVVAFTANVMQKDIDKCLKAGCQGHLPKPFTGKQLSDCLYEFLKPKPNQIVQEYIPRPPLIPDDPEGSLELVLMFVKELGRRLDKLKQALSKNDMASLELESHRLNGSAALYGFPNLHDAAKKLEEQAKLGEKSGCLQLLEEVTSSACKIAESFLLDD